MSGIKSILSKALPRSWNSSSILHIQRLPLIQQSRLCQSNQSNDSVKFTFINNFGEEVPVTAKAGSTVLDVCLDNELEVEGACGGECCCSTCHVYLPQTLYDSLEKPDEDELDMLDLAIAVKDTSRLGCQITVDKSFNGTVIELPTEVVNNLPADE
mmetsp:Transcript_33721/g.53966  ORF Transcript_33721/g.53966 Transcript_33721/m.53966 type:complete len:156 (+) Transcript_33721:25-492(+)